jgi:hypothetical protein
MRRTIIDGLQSRSAHPQRHPRPWIGHGVLWLGLAIAWVSGWCLPLHAAVLSDVRIGEYEAHTRIVFEFSEPIQKERIVDLPPDGISVTFGKARVDLKRKMSVAQSTRIREVRLIDRQGMLAAQIHLNFSPSRYNAFRLDRPPRLVVDVFHATAVTGKISPSVEKPATALLNAEPAVILPSPEKALVRPPDDPDGRIETTDSAPSPVEVSDASPQSTPMPHTSLSEEPSKPAFSSPVDQPASSSDSKRLTDHLYRPQKGQLQFFLWIALVSLSLLIAILALLLRMTRRRETAAPATIAREVAFENQAAPIIESIKRVESTFADEEPIIELTERADISSKGADAA